jgi:G3E family GTPase
VRNFERAVKMLTRSRHQVMIADVVLINKTDLSPEEVDPVRSAVEALNPYAEVVETRYCSVEPERYLMGGLPGHPAAEEFGKKESGGRPDIQAVILRINRPISFGGIGSFVKAMQLTCPRIKGFVNATDGRVYMIQSVFNEFETRPVEGYAGPSEIIAFGRGLTPGMLREVFLKYCQANR